MKYKSDGRKFWKSENADLNKIQICFPEIVQIWKGEIFEQLSQNLTLTESKPCWHVSWFWFLLEEVGCVHAHCTPMTPRSGTSSTLLSQNDFIHHQADIQNGEDCVLIKKDMCSPTSPSWFWTSTSSIPTRQLASPSSMTRRLTTVWWREVLHHLHPCGHQHSTTCAPFPSNHHITS